MKPRFNSFDEVVHCMPDADLMVAAAIVQSLCYGEMALRGILTQNGADLEDSRIKEVRNDLFDEIERRRRHDK